MLISFIEFGFSIAIFANALLFVPQAVKLLKLKESRDLSLVTFFGFLIIQLFTGLHGIVRHDEILAYGMLISMLTCGWVIGLIIYYRLK